MADMNNRTLNSGGLPNGPRKKINGLVAAAFCFSAVLLLAAEKEKKKPDWDPAKGTGNVQGLLACRGMRYAGEQLFHEWRRR